MQGADKPVIFRASAHFSERKESLKLEDLKSYEIILA